MLFKHSHQIQHALLIIGLSLHGTGCTGWERVPGVKELQGRVLMAAAPFFSSPPLCFEVFLGPWMLFREEDLHKAKTICCPSFCDRRAGLWVGLKRKRKEEAQQVASRRNAEKTLGTSSFWRDLAVCPKLAA